MRAIRPTHTLTLCGLAVAARTLSSTEASAQFPDLVDVQAQAMPGVPLDDPQPAEVQLASYDISLNVPIPVGEKTFLIPGVAYHVDSASYANIPPGFSAPRGFHAVDLAVLFVQLLPHEWALSLRIAPGSAGDFRAFDGDHVRFNALAMATRSFSERFVFGGGAMVSYAFGSALPLPALYLEWKPCAGYQVEAFLPAFVNAKYTIAARFEFGLRAEFSGNAYGIRDERTAAARSCGAGPSDDPSTAAGESESESAVGGAECLDHVSYAVGAAGIVLGVRTFSSVWITAFGGHSVFRRLEQLNENNDPITGSAQGLPNDFVFRAGVTWRIPRSREED